MNTEFREAVIPEEIRSLVIFDRKVFRDYPADWFHRSSWEHFEAWWMIVDNRKVGCCAFEHDVDFQEDVRPDEMNPLLKSSIYVVTTGIHPRFQGLGFGNLMKCWQVSYARHHGFTRIVTNTRKSNRRMIALNKRYGFKVLRTTSQYYRRPAESTVVMELLLGS